MKSESEKKERIIYDIFFCYIYNNSCKSINPIIDKISTNNAEYNISGNIKVFGQKIGIASSLHDALIEAKKRDSKFLVYCSIGNILRWRGDLSNQINILLNENKNLKFIGHILQHHNGSFFIDPQFFLIDVNWALENNITGILPGDNLEWTGSVLDHSDETFDDSNEPKWVTGTHNKQSYIGRGEGFNILEKLVETNSNFTVWPELIRKQKIYLYPKDNKKSVFNLPKILQLININKAYITNTEIIDKERYDCLIKYNIKKCLYQQVEFK